MYVSTKLDRAVGVVLSSVALIVLVTACAGVDEADVPPDEQYGHRYVDEDPEGRELLEVSPPSSDEPFFTYPLPVRDVTVRRGEPSEHAHEEAHERVAVPVDILIKGALPDACLDLHDISMTRSGHFLDISIEVRRPQGEGCRPMRRPYRLYVDLDEPLSPGSYTLRVNGEAHPFRIREP